MQERIGNRVKWKRGNEEQGVERRRGGSMKTEEENREEKKKGKIRGMEEGRKWERKGGKDV